MRSVKDVAAVAATALATAGVLVIDPFAGSGNTLYWLLRHLPGGLGLGFEGDEAVFRLTRQNLAALGLSIDILNTDYLSGVTEATLTPDQLLIAFIAPPWGHALDKTSGLDLRRNQAANPRNRGHPGRPFSGRIGLLGAVQIYETVTPGSWPI